MPIRPSASSEIRQLIDALGAADDVRRETAIARLAVIGPRAVEHLLHASSNIGDTRARAGMLRVLEAAGDPRAVAVARAVVQDAASAVDLQMAGVGVLRAFVTAAQPEVARDALDGLINVALDRSCGAELRRAAFDAMRELPASVLDPIHAMLAGDPIAAAPDPAPARARTRDQTASAAAIWRDAIEGRLPPSPDPLKRAVATLGSAARLIDLQHVIDVIRMHETRETDQMRRAEWRAVRGALHQALASRHSTLALYDLRDSLLDPDRLPVSFLAALEEVGDALCLEPLAGAYDASSRSGDAWWREHVATAFRAIVQREGLTRRHAAVKRALARWPEAAADLMARS